MRKNHIAITAAFLMLPALAQADIVSHTSATSATGGNTAGPGGYVETGGASASVTSSSVQGRSTSSVYIETDVNGQAHTESYSSDSNDVGVSVQATPKETTVDIREGSPPETVRHEVYAGSDSATTTASAEADASASASASTTASTTQPVAEAGFGVRIVAAIQGFFSSLLEWLK